MGLSKTNRILLLLAIDSAFFLLEIVVGYAVHSLALIADSFHMLNDVLSLIVGLWAVRVANSSANSKMYTYGWQRAETLGALINGVFLVALCLSIFLEAIQRFVEPQVVSNPKLVLIVGSCGLASNILGLFLFHDHGHTHGGEEAEEHNYTHTDPISNAEEGLGTAESTQDVETRAVASKVGNVADVLPQTAIGAWKTPTQEMSRTASGREFTRSDEDDTTASGGLTTTSTRSPSTSGPHSRHRRKASGSVGGRGFGSVESLHVHPASFRNDIIAASRLEAVNSESDEEDDEEALEDSDNNGPNERSELLKHVHGFQTRSRSKSHASYKKKDHRHDSWHTDHKHARPIQGGSGAHGGHGHSHGDLNMRGVFLHVMGDALGNIGVIASALFIWLTSFSWRYYVDPGVSLVITCIILASAIPLCKAASRILLQAVPTGLSIDDIRDDIEALPGVLGCHHLHVWQLSDTKHVASLHIQVDCDIRGVGSASYMHLARQVRRCLHDYGIHSSTIQPEFQSQNDGSERSPVGDSPASPFTTAQKAHSDHGSGGNQAQSYASVLKGSRPSSGTVSPNTRSVRSEPRDCLLECGDECARSKTCCPTTAQTQQAATQQQQQKRNGSANNNNNNSATTSS